MEKLIVYAAIGYPRITRDPTIPAIPRDWDELVDSAVAACEAGASILHFHGPHDDKGLLPEGWSRLCEKIRRSCAALIDFGQVGAPIVQRKRLLELGENNPDFMAVSLTNHDYRRHSAERGGYDVYYEHTREELEDYASCLAAAGVKPAWELWHLGGLWNLDYLVERGLATKPLWLNLFFGTPGGVWSPPTVEEINHRIANLPSDAPYLVAPRGTAGPMGQTRMLTFGIIKGAHVRLGVQDMAYYDESRPAQSNAELVARIVRISRELGREIATPKDARRILGLPAAKA